MENSCRKWLFTINENVNITTLRELIFARTNFREKLFRKKKVSRDLIFAERLSQDISRELIFAR